MNVVMMSRKAAMMSSKVVGELRHKVCAARRDATSEEPAQLEPESGSLADPDSYVATRTMPDQEQVYQSRTKSCSHEYCTTPPDGSAA